MATKWFQEIDRYLKYRLAKDQYKMLEKDTLSEQFRLELRDVEAYQMGKIINYLLNTAVLWRIKKLKDGTISITGKPKKQYQ